MNNFDDQAEHEDPLAKYTRQLANYTLWLMFATVLSTAAVVWTAYSTKQFHDFAEQQAADLKRSLEMTQTAIFVGNRQAAAAESAIEEGRQATKKQLRAYLAQLDIDTENILSTSLTTILHVKNVGATPAVRMAYRAATAVVGKKENVTPPSPYGDARDPSASVEVLGAGIDTIERIFRPNYSFDEIENLRSKKSILIVWGIVWYDDIFGVSHYTRFCKYFDEIDFRRWNLCASHNDVS
jgi:hypothetical protein